MTSRRFPLALAATIVATLGVGAWAQSAAAPAAKPVIIGYLFPGNELIVPSDIAAEKLTHINYAFADVKDGRVVEGFGRDAENFKLLADLRRAASAPADPDLRRRLDLVQQLLRRGAHSREPPALHGQRDRVRAPPRSRRRRHRLGYPGLRGNDNVHRPEDKQNFTAMMIDLRQALDAEGRRRNRRYLLTFAAGAFPDFVGQTEMDKVEAVVDFVNLMTYDFRTSDPIAGHHANLYLHPADEKKRSVDSAVRDFIAAGVPPAKIVVGVPFYGRAWTDIQGEGTGLYQPGSRPTNRIETKYGPMSTTLIDRGGFVRIWDGQAQARTCGTRKPARSSRTKIRNRCA